MKREKIFFIVFIIFNLFLIFVNSRECLKDDYIPIYFGKCSSPDQNRKIIYIKNPENSTSFNCENGEKPPKVKETLKCSISCGVGEYLKPPFSKCQKCEKGFYSSGLRFNTWDKKTINQDNGFRFFCWPIDKCNDWKLQNTFADSNEQESDEAIVIMYYEFKTLQENNHLDFEYKIDMGWDSEDKFKFYIDDTLKIEQSVYMKNYQKVQFPLSKGYHFAKWVFEKKSKNSISKAYVRNLDIFGIKMYNEQCSECPIGKYTDKIGSELCKKCPQGFISPQTGSSNCIKCDNGFYSNQERSKCLRQRNCTVDDYYYHFGLCDTSNFKQEKIYNWKNEKIHCNDKVIQLPKNEFVDCSDCGINFGTDLKNKKCVSCEDGKYFNNKIGKCEECPLGSAAIKVLDFKDFKGFNNKNFPLYFNSSGWIVENDNKNNQAYLKTLTKSEGNFEEFSILQVKLDFYTKGHLEFDFNIFSNEEKGTFLSIFLDSNRYHTYNKNDTKVLLKERRTSKIVGISKGKHILHIVLLRIGKDSNSHAKIYNFKVFGSSRGIATSCLKSPPGFSAPKGSSSFVGCQEGTFSLGNSEKCEKCKPGEYIDEKYSTKCKKCGKGTWSNLGSSECYNPCYYSSKNNEIYNITKLNYLGDLSEDFFPVIKVLENPMREREFESKNEKYLYNSIQKHIFGPFSNSTISKDNYFISICSKINDFHFDFNKKEKKMIKKNKGIGSFCFDPYRSKYLRTHSCVSNGEIGIDLGSRISYHSLNDKDLKSGKKGFNILMEGETYCITPKTNNQKMTTKIKMICNPKAGRHGIVKMDKYPEDIYSICELKYTIESSLACPLCKKSDYILINGTCNEKGLKKSSWFLRPKAKCNDDIDSGSYDISNKEMFHKCVVCKLKNNVDKIRSRCNNGKAKIVYKWKQNYICENGDNLPQPEEIECSEFEFGIITILIFIFVISFIIIGLMGITIYFYLKNRRIYQKYSLLKGDMSEMERKRIGNVEIHSDEEDDDKDFIQKTMTTIESDDDSIEMSEDVFQKYNNQLEV